MSQSPSTTRGSALPTFFLLLIVVAAAVVHFFPPNLPFVPFAVVCAGVLAAYLARARTWVFLTPAIPLALAVPLTAKTSTPTAVAVTVLLAATVAGAWLYLGRPKHGCPVLSKEAMPYLALVPAVALVLSTATLLAPSVAVGVSGIYVVATLVVASLHQAKQPWSRLTKVFVIVALLLAGINVGASSDNEQLTAVLAVLSTGMAAFALMIRNDLALYSATFAMVFITSCYEGTTGVLAAVTGVCIAMAHARLSYVRSQASDLRRRISLLRSQAERDELTGVLNRRGFEATASAALALASRTHSPCTLFYFDLDGFKQLNDRYGHARGDAFLRMFASLLARHLRGSDVIGRLGGDEFAVLAIDTGNESAAVVRTKVEGACRTAADGASIGVSIGSVHIDPSSRHDLAALLTEADARMYEEKRSRKAKAQAGVGNAANPM